MKVLLAHSFYQQRGGEEEVFHAECELLRSRGVQVRTFTVENQTLAEAGVLRQATGTIWNVRAASQLRTELRRWRPDVVHFHNTFPALSPAVYHSARREGVAVVQTLHNFRLLCPNGLFFREGEPCESCLTKRVPWPAVARSCYRESRSASAVVGAMLTTHRALGTWTRMVDVYIALTEFARGKFVQGGLPPERIVVKPNFVANPGLGRQDGDFALYVGRLSPEKGLHTLMRGWAGLADLPLKIVGDGPLRAELQDFVSANGLGRTVEFLGHCPRERVLELMKAARILTFPSECYEGGPRVVLEAMAVGTPVFCADRGPVGELVKERLGGFTFRPADPEDLAARLREAWSQPDTLRRISQRGREEYEARHTADSCFAGLLAIYERAMTGAGARRPRRRAAPAGATA